MSRRSSALLFPLRGPDGSLLDLLILHGVAVVGILASYTFGNGFKYEVGTCRSAGFFGEFVCMG